MKMLKTISFICYGLVALLGFVFAFIYLTRPEFMPYHADAVGMSWENVDANMKVLIIALMRVSGGGWLATSLAISFLLIAGRKFKKFWLKVALVSVGLAALTPTLYATLYVKTYSPAEPPWIAAAVAIVILLLALTLEFIGLQKSKVENRKS